MTIIEKLDPTGCGCDALTPGHELLSIDDALARIRSIARPALDVIDVPLAKALGCVLARDIHASAPTPPFDNSAMDGYALRAADLHGPGPWTLSVTGRICAGDRPLHILKPGTALQIFTGAPMPAGADTVIAQELVHRHTDEILLTSRPSTGENLRRKGEEMAKGTLVVPAGQRLGSRDIAACASAGHGTVAMHRSLRVALVLTGDELSQPGRPLPPGHIWDVNGPMLTALLDGPECQILRKDHVPDTRQDLCDRLQDVAKDVDLIVTSGGISVGAADHMRPAIQDAGGDILFSGIAIKPGKPLSFGQLESASWIGLPGNPVSAYVTWQVFGRALVDHLIGATPRCRRRHVILSQSLSHKPGRCELRPAVLSGFDGLGREIVAFQDQTHSARVTSLQTADGLLFIPAETDYMQPGDLVEFLPFD